MMDIEQHHHTNNLRSMDAEFLYVKVQSVNGALKWKAGFASE